jgi:hypothetical protein
MLKCVATAVSLFAVIAAGLNPAHSADSDKPLIPPLVIPQLTAEDLKSADGSHQVRNVPAFQSIAASGNIRIFVNTGDKQALSVEGDPNQLRNLRTEVRDGTLYIDREGPSRIWIRVNATIIPQRRN